MNNNVTNLIMFTAGAAIGSAVTWIFVKKKYEQIAQDEINSVKEVFSKKNKELQTPDPAADISRDIVKEPTRFEPTEEELDENLRLTANYRTTYFYAEYSKPYVIPPAEFGEKEDYDKISLTYYADNILVDDDNTLLEDVENVVGFESLTHFGEYEDDSVFVRNDRLQCDYEILLDQRKYSDVLKQKPYLAEE